MLPANVRFSLRTSRDSLREASELLRRLRAVVIEYDEFYPSAFLHSIDELTEEFQQATKTSLIALSNLTAVVKKTSEQEERRKRNE